MRAQVCARLAAAVAMCAVALMGVGPPIGGEELGARASRASTAGGRTRLASIRRDRLADNLILNASFEDDLESWRASSYHVDPERNDGTEEIVTDGCRTGKCLKLTHRQSTWQGAYQSVGELIPGKTYHFRAWFRTSATHYGHTNIRDAGWRNRHCEAVGRSTTRRQQGQGQWQSISQVVRIPEEDECGPLEGHVWGIYLYSYSPTSDPSPVYYDDISLVEISGWPLADLEEDSELAVSNCTLYSDDYPLVPCHTDVVTMRRGAPDGGEALILAGTREKQESIEYAIPVRPATLYQVRVSLAIEDRRMFNYLNLDYPTTWTRQREGMRDTVDLTRGLWSGLYSVTVDGVSILPPIIKDSAYRSPSHVDWFRESGYFETGPAQFVTTLRLRLSGFEGRLLVDDLTVEEATSFIDDEYLHIPVNREFQGMRIAGVNESPPTVTTNAARYVLEDGVILASKDGQAVAQIAIRPSLLAGLTVEREPGNIYLANDRVQLSIGADSALLVKLHEPAQITVTGPRAGYAAFDAGVLFATDYRRGVLFSPLRPPASVRGMPSHYDPSLITTQYDDADFEERGLKFWELVADFDEPEWRVDYALAAGSGFIAQVFPPKEFDEQKYCTERMHTIVANTVAQPDADFRYGLQRVNERINLGLVWMSSYAESENDLDPPEEYCRDSEGQLVHCDDPSVAARYPVGTRFDVTGPYGVAEPEALRRLVGQAHRRGMRILVYMSPQFYYTTDVDRFLADLRMIVEDYGVDGVYYDGLYSGRPLKSLELVRKTRDLLGDGFYVQHSSWVNTLIRRSHRFRVPFLDAHADVLWLGEGVKVVDPDTWNLNFCGRNVSNTVSTLLSELRPVDWSADKETSVALTLSPQEQISRTLACRGVFRVTPYSEVSTIHDTRFQTSVRFESAQFLDPYNTYCRQWTCGNGVCDVGETIYDCLADCAPADVDARLSRDNSRHECDAAGSVAQWLLDGQPLYRLHYAFDGELAADSSGYGHHPHHSFGVTADAPEIVDVDGRSAGRFDGRGDLYGEASAALDFPDEPLSAFATIRPDEAGEERQIVLSFNPSENLMLGLEDGRPAAFVLDGDKQYGTEEIVDEGCYAGRCAKARHNDATWQAISQSVGTLQPGVAHTLSAMFSTTPSHNGYLNLYDRDWKNAACQRVGKSYVTERVAGSGAWEPISVSEELPEVDSCGESTADDLFSVYLYTYSPVDDPSAIYYDEASLVSASRPEVNLLSNPGFEDGFTEWAHSSYIPHDAVVAESRIVDGAWHTIGLTYSPSGPDLRLYVDGVEAAAARIRIAAFDRLGRFTIGSHSYGSLTDSFHGLIDDVFVAGGELSLDQVGHYARNQNHTVVHDGDAECVFRRAGSTYRAAKLSPIYLPQLQRD